MESQHTRAHRNPARTHARLLGFLLPMLLVAQVLGGRSALFHAHGEIGGHVHVLSTPSESSTSHVADDWHHRRHASDDHRHPTTNDPGEAHEGLLIELPPALVATPGVKAAGAELAAHLRAAQAYVLHLAAPLARPPEPIAAGAEPPQVRRRRSGIAQLLVSSRALLI